MARLPHLSDCKATAAAAAAATASLPWHSRRTVAREQEDEQTQKIR